MTLFSFLAAVIPGFLILNYFRNGDLFPEPSDVIWKSFLLGVLIVVPVIPFAIALISIIGAPTNPIAYGFFNAFIGAAIPEELLKFAVLWFYCIRHQHFDEPMDGLVYGVCVSLGFAAFENVMYVWGGGMDVAIGRAFTAVPGHALYGAIMGYFIALYKFSPTNKSLWLALAVLVPILFHGLYDFPLFIARYTNGATLWAVPIVLIVQVILVRQFYLHFQRVQINGETELGRESE